MKNNHLYSFVCPELARLAEALGEAQIERQKLTNSCSFLAF